MMNQKGFINIIFAILAVALFSTAVYFISHYQKPDTSSIRPEPIACTMEAMQCPDGSYVGRTGPKCEFAKCPEINPSPKPNPSPVPKTTGEKITRKVGEQEGSFLIQKINRDSVEGLWYQSYPVARGEGTPKTLYIGDDIGYACEGISIKLTSINFSGQTVTFTKITGKPTYGGCPICLSGNTLIDTPSGQVRVKDMKIGMPIWTINKSGERIFGIVSKTSKVLVPPTHKMVHLILADGRELFASPKHPTIDGRIIGALVVGELYDGARIVGVEIVPYNEGATYDVLPSGETGFYFANGVLLGSTLR